MNFVTVKIGRRNEFAASCRGIIAINPAAELVFQPALVLPEEDRWDLVEALLASTSTTDGLPFHPSWLTVVRRRSAEIDAGTVTSIPWEEVRGGARRRIEVEAAWDADVSRRVAEIRTGCAEGRPIDGLLDELREQYP